MRQLHALTLVTLLVTGCSEEPVPAPPATTNPFPVRILPARPVVDPDLVSKETFVDGPGEWWALGMHDERMSLERVADSDLGYVEDGALVLPQGQTTLVRFVELPPGHQHDVSVVLHADNAVAGELNGLLHFAVLQELDDDQDAAKIIESQTFEAQGRTLPFLRALPIKFQFQRKRKQARWQSTPDLEGYAKARHRIIGTNTRRLYAIFVPSIDREVRLRSFEIRKVAEFRSKNSVSRSKEGAALVKLSGDIRPSVWIDPGEALELPAALPAGSKRLSFSIAPDPDAPRESQTQCSVRLVHEDGRELAGWARTLAPEPKSPEFLSVSLDFDSSSTDDANASLQVEVSGDSGVFLAQPLIRGDARDHRKNLLFISLDTLRADHLGSYGYKRNTSPFLDAFAARSARFSNYLSVAPYTLPTHATMLTGRLPIRHGAISETDRLDPMAVPYLPRILGDHGYVNAAFTGGGFLSDVFGFPDGFDQFRTDDPIKPPVNKGEKKAPPPDALDESHAMRDVLGWIESHDNERWFLFLHSFMVHDYKPPAEDLAIFDTNPAVTDGLDHFVYMRDREWVDNPPAPGDIQHYVDRYDATIHYTDRVLASFFDKLERAGILDDTIVVITSDHGEEFWEHGSLKHSVTLYDEMLRVPLWIHVPGIHTADGTPLVITEPTSQADLMPTLLELLDIDDEFDLDGHSAASFVRGSPRPKSEHTPLYASVDTRLSNRASLRVGRFKVIDNNRSSHIRIFAEKESELYDGRDDPAEQNDLSETERSRSAKMLEQLQAVEAVLRLGAVTGDHAEMTPELMEQLRELGYVGG